MTKYIDSDIQQRTVSIGTTLVRYHQNGEQHYQSGDVIDRPIVKTSTVVYLTFCALIVIFLLYRGIWLVQL